MEHTPLSSCPDADTLRQLVEGRLSDFDAESLARHVDICDHCADRIASFDDTAGPLTILSGKSGETPTSNGTLDTNPSDVPDGLDPPSTAGELGQLGPYHVLRELGRGGMGVVYAAHDSRLRRLVALKVMKSGATSDYQFQGRFEREIDALARLSHSNIVQVYEAGRHKNLPYLAMEFVTGGTLAGYLEGQPQSPMLAAELLATLAGAVHFAHQHGVVHRDLKPANILLVRGGVVSGEQSGNDVSPTTHHSPLNSHQPKIADFGLARHEAQQEMTHSGDMLGTPSYMAPEMMSGVNGGKDSPAVDIYGLGAILYELLTGRPPFRGESVPDTFEQVRHLDPVSVRRLQPRVPRDLETICLKCLQKDPRRRYATAAMLEDDLRRFLDGRPIVARPIGPIERAVKWTRRKPAWAAAIGVMLLATAVLIAVGVRYESRLRKSLADAERSAKEARDEREKAQNNYLEAQKQREKAQTGYREARSTMEKMLARASDQRRGDLPRVRELRNDQMNDALAFYMRVAEQDEDSSPGVRYDIADSRLQASLLQIQLGKREAQDNLQRAHDLLRNLIIDHPNESRFRRALVECLTQQGITSPISQKERILEQAQKETETLLATDPTSQPFRNDLARICHALGEAAFAAKRLDDSERHFTRAIEIRRAMLKEQPNWLAQRLALAQTQLNLLLVRQNLKRPFEELEPQVKELMAALEAIVKDDPGDPTAIIALAKLRVNWAHMPQYPFGRFATIAGLHKSIVDLEAFLAREPNWSEAKGALYAAHGIRAVQYEWFSCYQEAAGDYRRVVDLSSTPAERKRNRADLAYLLLKANDFGAAIDESERVANDSAPMPQAGAMIRHLTSCQSLAKFAVWKVRPYHSRAIKAARTALEQARQDLSAETWNTWLKSIRGVAGLSEFLKQLEIAEAIR